MPTVMITGASRGIGLEFVRQYAAEGWHVIAAARDPDNTLGLGQIAGDIRIVRLDVTDDAAITEQAQSLTGTPIDVLINNAGFTGDRTKTFGNIDYDHWQSMLRVNVIAPVRVTEAFIGHLEASDQKKVICVTSVVGSIERNDSGGRYDYRSSKAALNMMVTSMNNDLRARGLSVLALHPGWVQTEKNGPNAPVTLAESITGMRRVIGGLDRSTSGRFLNWTGEEYAW